MNLFLGIDTSAYTTSVALIGEEHTLIADERNLLQVETGQKGLRQSQALFLHLKNLPALFKKIEPLLTKHTVSAISVSAFPRRIPGSYMPVFVAGISQAQALGSCLGVPVHLVSHQEGHIAAGMLSNPELFASKKFLAVHFSGGTSEILLVDQPAAGHISVNCLLSGSDLHAGQLVDRVGVAMGLPFPAGKDLERLAIKSNRSNLPVIPSAINQNGFSFSGPETCALRLTQKGVPKEDIAFALLRTIANVLEKGLLMQAEKQELKEVLLVGGVMANSLIRQRLLDRLEHPARGFKLFFARPQLSTDNAVGVALLAGYLK